ncbi:MAG: hypothetical protein ITD45_02715 [Nitrosospira sp.]|nr:hypothetical protein [Nitrosospira sp.]
MQVTGYDNHLACGAALGFDLLHQPGLLDQPVEACRSAAWFWKTHGLNELTDAGDFERITRRINGGLNGQTTATFLDSAVTDAFRAFHNDQAMLRILSREANLQTASSARRPKVSRPISLV